MNAPQRPSQAAQPRRDKDPAQPQAAGERQTPATDMQPEDAGTPTSGQANRGSPAAPVMKQFAKTKAESSGGK